MRKLNYILFVLFFFLSNKSFCQTSLNILFLDKTMLNRYNVDTIKVISDPVESDTTGTYTEYHFQQGLIKEIKTLNQGIKGDVGFDYDRRNLLTSICTRDDVSAHQCDFENYEYLNGELRLTLTGTTGWSNITSESRVSGVARWFYYPDGRIKYLLEYGLEETDEKEISNLKIRNLMMMPELTKHLFLSHANDMSTKSEKHYFINYRNYIIGDYFETSDTANTYFKKLNKLKATPGFNGFGKENYPEKVYQQVIEDNSETVKSQNFLINGKPLVYFLSKIGKPNIKYIVIKGAENSYTLYKII